MTWSVERLRGSAAEFHARSLPEPFVPAVWIFDVDRTAVVLGSAQPMSVVDHEACARAGVEVVRRRSGGGAVLLEPDQMVWIDVVVPRGHPLWVDDVGRSMWWLGEVFVAALETLGLSGAAVHRGALVTTPWSRLVCFAGLGSGEVTVGGRKVVGISQRRTRDGARFQCLVPRRWSPEVLVPLLCPPRPTPSELAAVVAPVPHPADAIVDAILRHLP